MLQLIDGVVYATSKADVYRFVGRTSTGGGAQWMDQQEKTEHGYDVSKCVIAMKAGLMKTGKTEDPVDPNKPTYNDVRTQKVDVEAQLATLKLQEKQGELIPAAETRQYLRDRGANVLRRRVAGLINRWVARLPRALKNQFRADATNEMSIFIEEVLDTEIGGVAIREPAEQAG